MGSNHAPITRSGVSAGQTITVRFSRLSNHEPLMAITVEGVSAGQAITAPITAITEAAITLPSLPLGEGS